MKFFNQDFTNAIAQHLVAATQDGNRVTNKTIVQAMNLDEKKDGNLVSRCIHENLSDTYCVYASDGWGRIDAPTKPKSTTAHKASAELPEGFADAVRATLDSGLMKRPGVSNGFIQGKLDEQFPTINDKMITAAIKSFGTYASAPGKGWSIAPTTEETVA